MDVDVLIVGGGTAGTIAAIQAARLGARTMVVERSSQLGGTMTNGGVAYPGLFHAWGRQVIAGIGWELVSACVAMDNGVMPDFEAPYGNQHWRHQVSLNSALFALLAEEACLKAGVVLQYYAFPLSVCEVPSRSGSSSANWSVDIAGPGLRRTVTCHQLVDCTGGADVVGMLGFARERAGAPQPGTLRFRLSGYDVDRLDSSEVQRRYRAALEAGDLLPGDYSHRDGEFIGFLRAHGENAQHISADSSDAECYTAADVAGRSSLLRLLRFVYSLPGCETAHLEFMATETGVRESHRIVGEEQITVADYVAGRIYDDAVCYAFYPVDLHTMQGVTPQQLKPPLVPTVPLGALVPRGSRNLLVAGRSVSSDQLANSALRVQAACMAMGQAAGAAAALSALSGCTPLALPFERIKDTLRDHGAIVP